MTPVHISLREWEMARPDPGSPLVGHSFSGNDNDRELAETLTQSGRLEVFELVRGLQLRSTSFVGRVKLGDVEVTVRPKLSGSPLLNLFRYAYGLRHLEIYGPVDFATMQWSFQDLLIQQLGAEVAELLARGLHRDYLRVWEDLASPRGRIDFSNYMRATSNSRVALPCIYYPRSENTPLNQILLGGVLLGAQLAGDRDLRVRMHRLAKTFGPTVSPVPVDSTSLRTARRTLDRRITAYGSALTLIDLLLEGQGVSLDASPSSVKLGGFLFDMNRFFQALISRFLHEHLVGCVVEDEYRLKGTFSYDPHRNPQGKKAPVQKPDFAIIRNGQMAAVLDAKYRDLWELSLPSEMLYQLALYALSQTGSFRRSAILYPTLHRHACEQVIFVQEPLRGVARAQVVLRPVNLSQLEVLLRRATEVQSKRERFQMADRLAFGESPAMTQNV